LTSASLPLPPNGIYFLDTALANAFVAGWCIGFRVETIEGGSRLRADALTPRIPAKLHRALRKGSEPARHPVH
jgi:hypothetical protein